jgi:hypothetical protein
MTEIEWQCCTDPTPMLALLAKKATASNRKWRLLGSACCRRIWELLPSQEARALVAAIENYPEGTWEDPYLQGRIIASSSKEWKLMEDEGYWAVKYLGRSYYKCDAITSAIAVMYRAANRKGEGRRAERAAQAELVR